MTIRGAGLYGGTPPPGVDPDALSRALDEAMAARRAEPAPAEAQAEAEWSDPEPEAGL
jgi:hypothetical protein